MLIDSHCHLDKLDLDAFEGQLEPVLAQAEEAGVDHFLCIGVDLDNFPTIQSLAEQYSNISTTVGVHPCYETSQDPDWRQLAELAEQAHVVGIGETGLDYFMNKGVDPKGEEFNWQRDRFRTHIQAAKAVNKPIIIHTREAREDTLRIMAEEGAKEVGGVMHCFVEDLATAEAAIEHNFYISISGIVTFNSAKQLQEVVKALPLERLLVETDSPWLAPVPHRGKPNYPAYVREVAEFVAKLKGESYETVANVTSENYQRLFGTIG